MQHSFRIGPASRGRGGILKVEGHWPKVAFLYMTKIKRFYVVYEPNENFENMESPQSLYTPAKRALSFQQKRAFIQELLFSFFKWGTLAQKIFFTFKKRGVGGRGPCQHQMTCIFCARCFAR
jgi:hypothetical protein